MVKKLFVFMMAVLLGVCSAQKAVYAESKSPVLSFSDDAITEVTAGSGYTIEGTALTIEAAGVYTLTGSCAEGSITVSKNLNGVALVLENLTLTSASTAPLVVKKGTGATIHSEGENTLTNNEDPANETSEDAAVADAFEGAAIKVKSGSSAVFCGEGKLTVKGNAKNGIKGGAESSLIFNDGVYAVNAVNNGIAADGSVTINDGSFNITVQNDGIKSVPDTTDLVSAGKIEINGGILEINAQGDGIQAETELNITNGKFNIKTLNGADSGTAFDKDTMSCKGLKASGDRTDIERNLNISGGEFVLNTADDAVHSDGNVTITAGKFEIASGDDGVHADGELVLGTSGGYERDPDIKVSKSYEGLEGLNVNIHSGKYYVAASDDGINAAGGSDSGSNPNPDPWSQTAGDNELNINGGILYVNCDGDGLDSNGTLSLLGGDVIVYSMQANGDNSPLDSDGNLLIKGATVFAAGSNRMKKTPLSSSQKYTEGPASSGGWWGQSTTYYAGSVVRVTNGNTLLYNDTLPKNVNYILYSSPSVSTNVTFANNGTVDHCYGSSWMHNWDNGTVLTEATEETPGVIVYTCADCGRTERMSYKNQKNFSCEGHESYMSLNLTEATVAIGNTVQLSADVATSQTNPEIIWTSANEEIAKVDAAGLVTGIAVGETVITAAVSGTNLSATCTINVVAEEDHGYPVKFEVSEGTSIDIYYTQTYTNPDETGVVETVSRDSTTGLPDSSGSGQVNFRINPPAGYEVDQVTATGSYRNVKGPGDTGAENTYRITKVASELVVNVTVKQSQLIELKTVSLTLTGNIGVNFSFDIPAEERADTFVSFTLNGNTERLSAENAEADENGWLRFSALTAAKEMRDPIKVRIENAAGELKQFESGGQILSGEFEYSVEKYFNSVRENYQNETDLLNLVNSMDTYGKYTQIKFNYNTSNFTELPELDAVELSALDAFKADGAGSVTGITVSSISLSLESDTGVKAYFTVDADHNINEYVIKADNEPVELTAAEGLENVYYVQLKGAAAKDLDEPIDITITDIDGTETQNIKYYPLSYVRSILKNSAIYETELVDVCKALYWYWFNAEAYFAAQQTNH